MPGRDRFRDPRLTILLIIQLCACFIAEPLAALGLPIARTIGESLMFGSHQDRPW
jgi:hypothetical protein